ncbi:MAG: monoterpene epsilon-lactone hydrolase [Glaciecola sp.]
MTGPIQTIALGGEDVGARWRRRLLGAAIMAATRPVMNHRVPLGFKRAATDVLGRLSAPVAASVTVDEVVLGGRRTWKMTPPGAASDSAVLFLHGGGYAFGGLGSHGGAASELARRMGVTTYMPDYRLRPEHPNTAPLQDARAAYLELLEHLEPSGIVVTGDSAGGGLSLALAQSCLLERTPLPAALALHSPWVDADPETSGQRRPDAILGRGSMRPDAERWIDGDDPALPHLSPLHGTMAGLPATFVQWGMGEALEHDAARLVSALHAAGVDVVGEQYVGLWHTAHLHVGRPRLGGLLESGLWLGRTADFLGGHLH